MASKEASLLTKSSVPESVDFYIPKNTGIHKFEFFYGRQLLYSQGFYPVWTKFDLDIIKIANNDSPLTLIEHGLDEHKLYGLSLFDSMDASFKRFATIDLQEDKKRHWFKKILLRILETPALVGIWEAHTSLARYLLEGDGFERGAFWYIYFLRRPMSPDEFIPLLMEYAYKFRKLLDSGIFDPEALQGENIVVNPDVESFIFKDFTAARLCVSTSSTSVSQKIIKLSRQAGVVIEHKLGDVSLTSVDHLTERAGFVIYESNNDRQ